MASSSSNENLFAEQEKRALQFWEDQDIFNKLRKKLEGKPKWSFIDGPITANNPMGVHHAWGRTLKDVVQRYRALAGYDQRFQNGFDCQGLWVEVEVEKDMNLASKRQITEFGLDNFSRQCKARVEKYSAVQTGQSILLGQWNDWDHSYYTHHDSNIAGIWHFLKTCHEKGWLYKGQQALQWCARCGTALSQHEMADTYEQVTHKAVFIKAPLLDDSGDQLLIWTTTPWTLTANSAAAVNPELTYVRVRQNGETLILADSLVRVLEGDYEVMESLKGADLLGKSFQTFLPNLEVQDFPHRVIPWTEVSDEDGTGIVHIAPGCGQEDYQLSLENDGVPALVPINEDGYYVEGYGDYTGQFVEKVRDQVINELKETGRLYKVENYKHSYPHCWRCKAELVFRLDDAWFISCEEIRPHMIDQGKAVEWSPPHIEHRFLDWLHNMRDWNISRKRFWGLPLPFYPCECGHMNVIGSLEELLERAHTKVEYGVEESADGIALPELHRPWIDEIRIKCEKCGNTEVERVTEVGDCWLDAGIVPYSTLKYWDDKNYWNDWFPAEWVCEMREQTRLWFYAMMFMSVTLEGKTPYKRVLAYEKVHDEKGKPMHKSAGNAIWFDEAVEKMGADVMRWMYAAQNPSENLRFGYTPAKEIRRRLIVLQNVVSFFQTYIDIDKPSFNNKPNTADMEPIDKWLYARTQQLVQEATRRLEAQETPPLIRALDRFISDLSNWYVRLNRDRFWASGLDANKQAAYDTLFNAIQTLTVVMAPVVPFFAEEIHQSLIRQQKSDAPESVHLSDWPKADEAAIDKDLVDTMDRVQNVVTLGLSVRNANKLKVRQPLSEMVVIQDKGPELSVYVDLMKQEMNVKSVRFDSDPMPYRDLAIKPNLKVLGPRLGPALKAFREKVAGTDAAVIEEALNNKGAWTVNLDGETVEITRDELLVEPEGKDGYAVAAEGPLTVALQTEITEELRLEGIARDVIRQIQDLRKKADLNVTDRIVVCLSTDSDTVRIAVDANKDTISHECLAEALDLGDGEGKEHTATFKLDGDEVTVSLCKA